MIRMFVVLCCGLLTVACDSSTGALMPTAPTTTAGVPDAGAAGPRLGSGIGISLGQRLGTSVQASDPACYPDWDANGQCRQFDLIAPQDGTLAAHLTWTEPQGANIMTLFVVSPNGSWLYDAEVVQHSRLSMPITAGSTYRLIVMSYAAPQEFELTTALR